MAPVELLKALLRINTINPPGNESAAAELLSAELSDAGLKTSIFRSPSGRANLVGEVEGAPDASPLVLLSHLDVVGVEEDSWSVDPFAAVERDGAIWGRGALDMKGIAVMHAAAAAAVVRGERAPRRSVIVVAAADEEAGGNEGARWLVAEHPHAVGFRDGALPPEVVGEGAFGLTGVIDRPLMPIAFGEKRALWLEVVARGKPGHGSLPPRDQALVNLCTLVQRLAGFKNPRVHDVMKRQFAILAADSRGLRSAVMRALASPVAGLTARAVAPALRQSAAGTLLSDVATPTQISGGFKHNVIPAEAKASLDCRLLPDTDPDEFLATITRIAARYGATVSAVASHGGPVSAEGHPLYRLLELASRGLDERPVVVPTLSPAITDVRYFRQLGAAGYGWVPLTLTPELLSTVHGHDERVPVDAFLRAVDAMADLVVKAAE